MGAYEQVGCPFVIASLIVGLIIGLVGAWMATGGFDGSAVLGLIVGFAMGFLAPDPSAALAVSMPALRDRIVTLAYVWSLVVPGSVTAATIILLTPRVQVSATRSGRSTSIPACASSSTWRRSRRRRRNR